MSQAIDLDQADYEGKTALILAAENGHTHAVLALAGFGADINIADYDGYTALMHARANGHIDTAHALEELGATVPIPQTETLALPC